MLSAFTLVILTGCHGLRASTDNASLKSSPRFDSEGKFTTEPEVSIPLWNSKGLKQKPQDIIPKKN